MVCDEPVSALDVSIQAQVINLLADLQEQMGLTYLFISHNLSVVKHCCQRIGVMYLGRIVELAPSARIYENAGHPYTQALISAIPKVEAATGEKEERILLGGDLPSPHQPAGRLRVPHPLPLRHRSVPAGAAGADRKGAGAFRGLPSGERLETKSETRDALRFGNR